MFEKLLDKIDLKWWSSLEAQKQMSVFLTCVIIGLLFVSGQLYNEIDRVRKDKNIERDSWIKKNDECNEKRFKMVEKYELLWYETEILKREIKPMEKWKS